MFDRPLSNNPGKLTILLLTKLTKKVIRCTKLNFSPFIFCLVVSIIIYQIILLLELLTNWIRTKFNITKTRQKVSKLLIEFNIDFKILYDTLFITQKSHLLQFHMECRILKFLNGLKRIHYQNLLFYSSLQSLNHFAKPIQYS